MSSVSLSPPPAVYEPGPSTTRKKKRERKPSDTPAARSSPRIVQSSASESEGTHTVFHRKKRERKPYDTRAPRRSPRIQSQSSTSASENEGSEVILLKKAAVGSNAARSCHTQYKFMQVMGMIDDKEEMPDYLPCPITDEQVAMLTTANSHLHSSQLDVPLRADGLYISSTLDHMLEQRDQQGYSMCNCVAHKQLAEEGTLEYKRHLRQLLRTPHKLQKETGLNFALSFFGIFFYMAGYESFVPQCSGVEDGVSYVLMANSSELHFKGHPDYVVYDEREMVATRILIVMGEIQSTNNPQLQNAIYAVGCLPRTPLKQLLVATIYKNKSMHLSIARLRETTVTIKSYCTPHILDLTAEIGVRKCLTLIHHYLKGATEQIIPLLS